MLIAAEDILTYWQTFIQWLNRLSGLEENFLEKFLYVVAVVLVYLLVRLLVARELDHRVKDPARRYIAGKTSTYVLSIFATLAIANILLKGAANLGTFLGLASAGLAIALQQPISNLAGWLFIIIRKPFKVGDRVQIGENAGDVIDIRLFMFSMLEVGHWVDADQSTGRILHMPNGTVFRLPIANYTQGFEYIWNEIPITITFESDWKKAQEIVNQVANEHTEQLSDGAEEQVRKSAGQFMIFYKHLKPVVWLKVTDIGVKLTIRYLCNPRKRRSSEDVIWKAILEAFGKENEIDFAYPTQRFFDHRTEGKSTTKPPEPQKESE